MVDGGKKNANNPDPKRGILSNDNTQPVDTQISSESFPGKDPELYRNQCMVPADDRLFFNDAFETQLVNLCGENQFLDFGGETQVVDFGGETQVVDFGGETQVVDFCSETQRVDLGGETQVVEDHDGLQNERIRTSENLSSIDQVKFTKSNNSNTGYESSISQSDVLSNDKHQSGSLQRGFTSIRAASVRASGLAAYDMSHKGTKGSTRSIKNGNLLEKESPGQNVTSMVGPQSEVRKELNPNA
uniref:Uncharacterized protein n=1 Tax=Nicotiana tabacum TaxID=4097 RepID=A0A1S3XQ25_TOBAC